MTLSPCPDGILYLGYVPDSYPYIWTEEDGTANGIFTEFWSTMAPQFGCSSVDYRAYSKQRNDSGAIFGGAISSGEAFTAVGMTWLRPNDPLVYRTTSPVIWGKMTFVEASKTGFIESTDLSFYTVFPSDIFIMIIAASIIVQIISTLHKAIPLIILDLLRGFLYQYSFAFLIFIWNGNFKGNTLITSSISQNSFSSMVSSFKSGIRKLVLNSGDNYFTEEEVPIILGSYDNADWCADMEDCFQMVCNETSRVGLFYQMDIYSFFSSPLTETCSLAEIVLPHGQSSGIGWLTRSLNDGDFYTFVISKEQRRWILERIDWALLTVYTEDNINSLFLRRSVPFKYVLKAARKQEEDMRRTELQPIIPVSFLQIAIPLQILAIGSAISFIVFIIEQIVSRLKFARAPRFFRSVFRVSKATVSR